MIQNMHLFHLSGSIIVQLLKTQHMFISGHNVIEDQM